MSSADDSAPKRPCDHEVTRVTSHLTDVTSGRVPKETERRANPGRYASCSRRYMSAEGACHAAAQGAHRRGHEPGRRRTEDSAARARERAESSPTGPRGPPAGTRPSSAGRRRGARRGARTWRSAGPVPRDAGVVAGEVGDGEVPGLLQTAGYAREVLADGWIQDDEPERGSRRVRDGANCWRATSSAVPGHPLRGGAAHLAARQGRVARATAPPGGCRRAARHHPPDPAVQRSPHGL